MLGERFSIVGSLILELAYRGFPARKLLLIKLARDNVGLAGLIFFRDLLEDKDEAQDTLVVVEIPVITLSVETALESGILLVESLPVECNKTSPSSSISLQCNPIALLVLSFNALVALFLDIDFDSLVDLPVDPLFDLPPFDLHVPPFDLPPFDLPSFNSQIDSPADVPVGPAARVESPFDLSVDSLASSSFDPTFDLLPFDLPPIDLPPLDLPPFDLLVDSPVDSLFDSSFDSLVDSSVDSLFDSPPFDSPPFNSLVSFDGPATCNLYAPVDLSLEYSHGIFLCELALAMGRVLAEPGCPVLEIRFTK